MQTRTGVYYIQIEPDQAGQRLDNFMRARYKTLPKSHLYRLIRKGEVRINKKRISPDYRLQAEDMLRIPPMTVSEAPKPPISKLSLTQTNTLQQRILYEDKHLIILNKPSGMAVHGGSGIRLGVIEAFRCLRPLDKKLELVHRLDRETSGCLLIAKKPSILRECHALLREGKMRKRYLLLVKGRWPEQLRYIEEALNKNQLQGGERIVQVDAAGKPSKTFFTIKQRFAKTTLLEAQPETGRTHQIRVHALHAGHPIIGDAKYGDKETNKLMQAYGCDRLFLHAHSLEFTLSDLIQQKVFVEAPLDEDLQKCLRRLVT